MAFTTLIATQRDGVFTIALNRPEKRNSINYEMMHELIAALAEAESLACRVVILTGTGKAFCAGMDLDNLRDMIGRTNEQYLEDSQTIARMFRAIYELPCPTIAAVNGAAIAGGAGLATMCDFTLAVPDAKFGYTEARIGFVPAIVSCFLQSQVGDKRCRELLLSGRIFDAQEGYRLGLVTEVVPENLLAQRTQELAASLSENSPSSLRETKKLLTGYMKDELARRIGQAIKVNASVRGTPDFEEGIASFLEKRRPAWKRTSDS